MAEEFFKVSYIRMEGGAHEITLIGFGAEGLALRHAAELEKRPIRYVVVTQRFVDADEVSWDVVREWKAETPADEVRLAG